MKSKTELDQKFEYNDSRHMAKVALIFAGTALLIGIIIGAIIIGFAYNSGFFEPY